MEPSLSSGNELPRSAWLETGDGPRAAELEAALGEARARLEITLAAAEIGTWEFDVASGVVTADRNMARIFGVDEALAVAGVPIGAFLRAIHPEDLPGVEAAIGESIAAGERFESEYRLVTPSGGVRWVVARGRVMRGEDGRALRLPGVVVDITAQRVAEIGLRDTLSRWHLALESAGLGAWNIDPATRTLRTDARFRQIFQGSDAPISYEGAFSAIHPEDVGRVSAAVEASMDPADPAPYAEEYRVIHPDGKVVWVLGKGRANFDGTGPDRKLVSLDGTVSDITERKEEEAGRAAAEDGLRELAAKLSEADRRKDEFLATLAHELRNPLAPIRTGLEIMRLSTDKPQVLVRLQAMMETQTVQLVRLIDDLLEMSRITSGKVELRRVDLELGAVIRSAVEAVEPAAQAESHTLHVHLPALPVRVHGDPARISQIVSNLLTNAVRYTNPGGEIHLTVAEEGEAARISVRDNGIGIAPEMLGSIFEMFTQAQQAMDRSRGGLGIGLTLVQRLTELHGGSVEARSGGVGQGSEFIVRLPRLPAGHLTADVVAAGEDAPRIRRILIVDDNVAAAESIETVLRLAGNETRVAHDGEECLAVAEDFLPEMILMDIGMPRMNGYEAAVRIRRQPWGAGIVLVALTGWGQESDRAKAREAGFDHHLVKPVEPSRLVELLRR